MARRSAAPVRRATVAVQVLSLDAIDGTVPRRRPDTLVTEEPLEIRLHGPGEEPVPVAVTMRTPGNDFELALGFLHAEGLVTSTADVVSVAYCLGDDGEQEYNVVTVRHRHRVGGAIRPRSFVASSSCGLCGKTALDEIAVRCDAIEPGAGLAVSAAALRELPQRLLATQTVFGSTGGLHAAALFDAGGAIDLVREDVGRHNAVDKLVGNALLEGRLPITARGVVVSGRLGFELVQKAAVARIAMIAAVGAPSSLAIDAARRFGITVVAFLRDDRFNIYTHPERVGVDG